MGSDDDERVAVDTSNDAFVLSDDHVDLPESDQATYLKLNHRYIQLSDRVKFDSHMGILRNSAKWNYRKRQTAIMEERIRKRRAAKSKADVDWLELIFQYHDVLDEFYEFPEGITPTQAHRTIMRSYLKLPPEKITIVSKMFGKTSIPVLTDYLNALADYRRREAAGQTSSVNANVKPETSDDAFFADLSGGRDDAKPPSHQTCRPVSSQQVGSSSSDDMDEMLKKLRALSVEANELQNSDVVTFEADEAPFQERYFTSNLKEARELASSLRESSPDVACRLGAILGHLEGNGTSIINQYNAYSALNDNAFSLLAQISQQSLRLANYCAWLKNELCLREAADGAEAMRDDVICTPKKWKMSPALALEVDQDTQVTPKPTSQILHPIAQPSESILKSSAKSVPQTYSTAGKSRSSSSMSKKQADKRVEVQWDKTDRNVEIKLGWVNIGGTMRRLVDTMVEPLRVKGIIILEEPDVAADEQPKWYQDREDEFENALLTVVQAYKTDVISM